MGNIKIVNKLIMSVKFRVFEEVPSDDASLLDKAANKGRKYILHHKEENLWRIQACRDFADVHKGDFGGFVESKENLSRFGDCWIYDEAKVYEDAWIYDNAHISDDAHVYGNALVGGNAQISGNAQVHDYAMVHDYATVSDNAEVYGNAHVFDNAYILGKACVRGKAKIHGKAKVNYEVSEDDITEW